MDYQTNSKHAVRGLQNLRKNMSKEILQVGQNNTLRPERSENKVTITNS